MQVYPGPAYTRDPDLPGFRGRGYTRVPVYPGLGNSWGLSQLTVCVTRAHRNTDAGTGQKPNNSRRETKESQRSDRNSRSWGDLGRSCHRGAAKKGHEIAFHSSCKLKIDPNGAGPRPGWSPGLLAGTLLKIIGLRPDPVLPPPPKVRPGT